LSNKDRACRLNGSYLQILFRAKMREEAAFAHGQLARESADGQALEAFCRGNMHGSLEDGIASALTFWSRFFRNWLAHCRKERTFVFGTLKYSTNVRF